MEAIVPVLTGVTAALGFVALGIGIFVLDLLSPASSTGNRYRGIDVDQGMHLG